MHTLLSTSVNCFINALIVRVYINCFQLATVQLSITLPRVFVRIWEIRAMCHGWACLYVFWFRLIGLYSDGSLLFCCQVVSCVLRMSCTALIVMSGVSGISWVSLSAFLQITHVLVSHFGPHLHNNELSPFM